MMIIIMISILLHEWNLCLANNSVYDTSRNTLTFEYHGLPYAACHSVLGLILPQNIYVPSETTGFIKKFRDGDSMCGSMFIMEKKIRKIIYFTLEIQRLAQIISKAICLVTVRSKRNSFVFTNTFVLEYCIYWF